MHQAIDHHRIIHLSGERREREKRRHNEKNHSNTIAVRCGAMLAGEREEPNYMVSFVGLKEIARALGKRQDIKRNFSSFPAQP